MALDYRKCAEEIAANIGGGANVVSAAHCATRLRLVIADNGKVNKKALEEVDGVKGMFESNGQLQLIIGTGTVNKVFDEFIAVTGVAAGTKDDVKAAAAAKQPLWRQALKTVGDVFVPILPAIVASGLMMGLVEALAKIPGLGFGDSDWFAFLDTVANTAFAYLPVIVAVSAARVFGGNIFLGAVTGLLMIHSAFLNGWNVANTDAINSFFGVTDGVIPKWHLIGNIVTIQRSGYQGHVIPVIIAVFIMCKVEKWLHKHVPEMIDLFVTPLTTVFVTAFLTLWIVGPIFSTLETYVLAGAKVLVRNPIGAGIMGAIYPATVVMGLHHMYNVIEAGMLAESGLNTWMPIASAANFAQFGACLAVGLKVKNQKTKSVAVPSSLSAALGITEPAIFGVNMRFFKPFVAGMIGGAAGSLVAAILGFGATAYGVTGIPGYLTVSNPLQYTIVLAIAGGIAFALTTMFWHEEAPAAAPAAAPAPAAPAADAPKNAIIKCEAGEIIQPTKGKIITQENIPDETFASGVLGAGVAIDPEEGVVYAPYDGTISSVAESKHAIGITGAGDMEVLIHVGVDTVAMNGDGFTDFVKEGDTVKAGQKIMEFDRAKIKAANHPDCVVVLLTNADDYENVKVGE
ncbi:MAG: PTS glucose transporter subunit IIA [Firmicutes bacterium]|nr:PTS glucose transporter subunit IIA [Bacillota bacterium]MBR7058767.1 PTS glucose transporter subunit IIA [Stomatobaculum sp.]